MRDGILYLKASVEYGTSVTWMRHMSNERDASNFDFYMLIEFKDGGKF